jgi:hypothetical protein
MEECNHIWKIIQKEEQPSPFEIMSREGLRTLSGFNPDTVGIRSVIVTRYCQKCLTQEVVRV